MDHLVSTERLERPQPRRTGSVVGTSLAVLRGAALTVRATGSLLAVAIVSAIALWLFVTDEQNPTRDGVFPQAIPVQAVNVGRGLAVGGQLSTVDVRISAPEDRWRMLTPANFRAVVDMSGSGAREQTVDVHLEVIGVSGVRVLQVSPERIPVVLEPLATKDVPVAAKVVGTLPRGYELTSAVPDRTSATVTGPQSLVALVAQVDAQVNVAGLTVGIQESAELVPMAAGGGELRGVTVTPRTVSVSVQVTQSQLTRTLPLVADLKGQVAAGYYVAGVEVSPSVVVVDGPIELLQGLDQITLSGITVEGADKDVRTVARIPSPPGITVRGSTTADVTVLVKPLGSTTKLTVTPVAVGLGAGLTMRTVPVSVTLQGSLTRLAEVSQSGIVATVNLSGLGVGTHSVPVRVDPPSGLAVREVQPASVSVTIDAR